MPEISVVCLVFTAMLAYLNARFVKLITIGLMVTAPGLLLLLMVLDVLRTAHGLLSYDFSNVLIFSALISPLDPTAVISIMKSAEAPKRLEYFFAGESLFNDGIGVVSFSLLVEMLASGNAPTASHAARFLPHEDVDALNGGIRVALCPLLPATLERTILIASTDCVVAFSILVQQLAIGGVVRRVVRA